MECVTSYRNCGFGDNSMKLGDLFDHDQMMIFRYSAILNFFLCAPTGTGLKG